jgi:hypothetical protein
MKLFSGISKRISRQIRASSFLLLFLAVLIPQCALYAQESLDRGVVTGVVRDTTGALVVGANVSVTNTDTSVVIPTSTNSAGTYAVRAPTKLWLRQTDLNLSSSQESILMLVALYRLT